MPLIRRARVLSLRAMVCAQICVSASLVTPVSPERDLTELPHPTAGGRRPPRTQHDARERGQGANVGRFRPLTSRRLPTSQS